MADSSTQAGIASVFLCQFVLFGQCHLKQIWKPRSIGYRGHAIIKLLSLLICIVVITWRTVGLNNNVKDKNIVNGRRVERTK